MRSCDSSGSRPNLSCACTGPDSRRLMEPWQTRWDALAASARRRHALSLCHARTATSRSAALPSAGIGPRFVAAFVSYRAWSDGDGRSVLTEDEVGPVCANFRKGGIEISGRTQSLIGESPARCVSHIASHGDAVKMAHAIQTRLRHKTRTGYGQRAGGVRCLWELDQKRWKRPWVAAER